MANWMFSRDGRNALNELAREVLNGVRAMEPMVRQFTESSTPHYSLPLEAPQTTAPRSLAEERMAVDAKRLADQEEEAQMAPQKLVPEGIPEGVSMEGPSPGTRDEIPLTLPETASSTQYLLHLCQCGLAGAILSGEILGPPVSRRRRWGR